MPYRRLPALSALRAFEAVARHGAFKAAAGELNVTPGALSQQVRKLEDELGVPLFVRQNRRIEPTAAALRLKSGLTDAFTRMREAVEAVRNVDEESNLVLAASQPFAAKWLVPRLGRFVSACPGFNIRVVTNPASLDASPCEIDVGIEFGAENGGGLHRDVLLEESVLPLASPGFVEAQRLQEPRDMLRVPLLTEESMAFCAEAPSWGSWFEAAGLPATGTSRGINFGMHAEQAIDAAVAGAGVVLGRRTLAALEMDQGRLVAPFGPELDARICYELVCREDKLRSEKVALFRDWLFCELDERPHPSERASG